MLNKTLKINSSVSVRNKHLSCLLNCQLLHIYSEDQEISPCHWIKKRFNMANVCVNTSLMGQILERPVAKTIRQNPRGRRQIKNLKKNTNHKYSFLKRRVLFG